MPFIFSEKNMKQVFSEHLQMGEKALVVIMSGARGVLGITDKNRVYQTNFPFFGASKIKEEYYLSDIFSCECRQKNTYTMVLSLEVKGENKEYKSTITPAIDSKSLVNEFVALVTSKNRNARPSYLDSDEEIVDHISTKKNDYKITNKNMITFSKNGDMVRKRSLSEFSKFDFYPGKTDTTYLYFETQSGENQLLNIGTSSTSIVKFAGTDPEILTTKVYDLLQKHTNSPFPDYLNSENLICTIRAGTSLMGAVNPSHVLKLTDNRLLDLKPNQCGGLDVLSDIALSEIESSKVIRNKGNNYASDIYELKIRMKDNTKLKYTMGSQYKEAIDKITSQINS